MARPKPIADILSQLLARRGYAREQSTEICREAWKQAAGDLLAEYTRPGLVRRGVLEVFVANSTLLQELAFQKTEVLARLVALLPDQPVRDLKFRIGPVN